MAVKYYVIRDVKANEFGDLIFARNDDVAKRIFGQILSKNPYLSDDLQLYYVGEFDNVYGRFDCDLHLIVDNVAEENIV